MRAWLRVTEPSGSGWELLGHRAWYHMDCHPQAVPWVGEECLGSETGQGLGERGTDLLIIRSQSCRGSITSQLERECSSWVRRRSKREIFFRVKLSSLSQGKGGFMEFG